MGSAPKKKRKSPGQVLKAKGLIPKEWNLKNLTRGQKSWVTKQSKTFSEVVRRPNEFSTISAKTATHSAQAKSSGLKVTNGRAVVKVGPGGHVRRRGDKLVISNSEKKVEVWFANHKNFNDAVRKARSRKLNKNQVWKFQIGEHLSSDSYTNLDDMLKYLKNHEFKREDAKSHITLALVTVNRGHVVKSLSMDEVDDDEDEDEDEEE